MFQDLDRPVVEDCLPAHMMALMAERIKAEGWSLRADIARNINQASIAPLAKLDPLSQHRIARKVDEAATALLYALAPDNPSKGLITVCHWVLELVEEGLIQDVQSQAVLTSLLLSEEIKVHPEEWEVTPEVLSVWTGNLTTKARLLGFYLRQPGRKNPCFQPNSFAP